MSFEPCDDCQFAPNVCDPAACWVRANVVRARAEGLEEAISVIEQRGREVKGAIDPAITIASIRARATKGGSDEG